VIDVLHGIRGIPVGSARDTKPTLQAVSPQIADRLRKFLAATPAGSRVDSVGNLLVAMFC
jgi:hypothetical protein